MDVTNFSIGLFELSDGFKERFVLGISLIELHKLLLILGVKCDNFSDAIYDNRSGFAYWYKFEYKGFTYRVEGDMFKGEMIITLGE